MKSKIKLMLKVLVQVGKSCGAKRAAAISSGVQAGTRVP
jgi:hypothetical protein